MIGNVVIFSFLSILNMGIDFSESYCFTSFYCFTEETFD